MPSPILTHPDPPHTVVVAPTAFKGTLSAAAAASAMADGVRRVLPTAIVRHLPLADGGDGSVDAFVAAGFTRVPVRVHGPTGQMTTSSFALRAGHAVVELADTCGLARLPDGHLAPMTSTTVGLGDAIRGALDASAERLTICLGGSASTDGGSGLLTALGARLIDARGLPVPPGGDGLARVARLDLEGVDPRLADLPVAVATDVASPLVGPDGAAAVFAPQKGATPEQVALLDAGLRAWAGVLADATGREVASVPGAGAAGGTAAALVAVLGAGLTPGAALIADLVGLDRELEEADLVITGEGRLDRQTLLGKGVALVVQRARAVRVPVIAVSGRIDLTDAERRSTGLAGWAECIAYADSDDDAMARAAELVTTAAADAVGAWTRRQR